MGRNRLSESLSVRFGGVILLAGLGLSSVLLRGAEPAATAPWQTPPGGTATQGGEGGRVLAVTTLAPNGPGSLGEALAAREPRTIVFKVGGVIDLGGQRYRLDQPNVTIAGETAPEPGITLIRGGMNVGTHDVI